MDSAGFLIMHEDFLAHSEKAQDLEYVHITTKEKNIAEHLITIASWKNENAATLRKSKSRVFMRLTCRMGESTSWKVETAAVNTNSTRLLALMLI